MAVLIAGGAGLWYYQSSQVAPLAPEPHEVVDGEWLEHLHSQNPKVAEEAARQVTEMGASAVPEIQEVLRDPAATSGSWAGLRTHTATVPREITQIGGLQLTSAAETAVDIADHDPEVLDCDPSPALVHIDGFEHSPFECGFECCHRDLYPAVFVYTMVLNNFIGLVPDIYGEPYVAIEPDQPCP